MSPSSPLLERRWAICVAAGVMALTMLPYLFGGSLLGAQPARGWFSWLGYNLDDGCVYLSWIRQAADGSFFQRNLFTTEAQSGHAFNLFFLTLGALSRITTLPPLVLWHLSRLILGGALLRAVWWLLELLIEDYRARRTAFLIVCFSSGLGWLFWQSTGHDAPMDVWQPEAITFLCLYLNPLFSASLLLMVGVIGWLWVAEQTQQTRPALYAGLCGLLLGNIHTYDVVTVAAVWGAFLLVRTLMLRRWEAASWIRALIAGAMTATTTGYTLYLLQTEAVFAKRAAVETLSPPLLQYALGYGLILLLAIAGVVSGQRSARTPNTQHLTPNTDDSRLTTHDSRLTPPPSSLLLTWAVVNIAVAYLPVSFQRKMLMGAHLPLAMLAGVGLAYSLQKWEGRRRSSAMAAVLALLFLTNARFLLRDMSGFQENRGASGIQRPYLFAGEVAALRWIRDHAPNGAPIQPLPWIQRAGEGQVAFTDTTTAALAPGLTGHPVHAGHWGETPDFGQTMGDWQRFLLPTTPDDWRRDLLRRSRVRYLLFSQKRPETGDDSELLSLFRSSPPPYLRLVPEASNEDADLYEVTPF